MINFCEHSVGTWEEFVFSIRSRAQCIVIRSTLLVMLARSSIFSLIFCSLVLSNIESGIFFFSSHMSCGFCFINAVLLFHYTLSSCLTPWMIHKSFWFNKGVGCIGITLLFCKKKLGPINSLVYKSPWQNSKQIYPTSKWILYQFYTGE